MEYPLVNEHNYVKGLSIRSRLLLGDIYSESNHHFGSTAAVRGGSMSSLGESPAGRMVYTMWGPQWIAKLVNITPITMVYGMQITIVTGANLKQLITGGPHIVCIYIGGVHKWGYPKMVYNGKSYSHGWWNGYPRFRKPPYVDFPRAMSI